ncbi:INO80 complex subunit E isoform X1 [Mesocricetus auratus]|uniref:INO80 complex subunit E isoform X1 n=1 Tax=Mesocricetus auratus TaxID=10036 RepID=A0ABM2Y5U7_MESAU|nr:INO80 complex subunit E isoform X1 [Mesocricetus auratus]
MNGPADGEVDYKKKYRNLKRKLKFLIYEHECFQEELRKAQRKLLKVSRDKSFLLDRLLQYENVDEDSSDSDATASSDNSETEGTPKLSDTPAPKRKRSPPMGGAPSPSSLSLPPSTGFPLQTSGAPSPYLSSLASPPYPPFPSDYLALQLPEPSPLRPKLEKRPRLPRKLKIGVHETEVDGRGRERWKVNESELRIVRAFEKSKLTSSETPPPTRPTSLFIYIYFKYFIYSLCIQSSAYMPAEGTKSYSRWL